MKVAIYVRVSTDMQVEEGYSLDAQIDRCKAYATSQDWEIVEIYVEEGESAKDLNRTEIKRLLADAKEGLFDVLLVYRLDRLTRSVRDLHALLDLFDQQNIKFRSATEVYDTTSAMGRLFINIVASLAEWERANLGERVQFGMHELVKQGKWPGGPVPYGYRWDGEMMHIVPEEAEILREMRKLYMAGNGLRTVCVILNTRGLFRRKGMQWNPKAVNYALNNAFYAGKIEYGEKNREGKYPEMDKASKVNVTWSDTNYPNIFSWEDFIEHSSRRKKRQTYGHSRKTDYWFSGILRCGRCGRTLVAVPKYNRHNGVKGELVVYYICSARNQGSTCKLPMFRQVVAERLIMTHINAITLTYDEIAADTAVNKKSVAKSDKELDSLRSQLRVVGERRKKWQYMFAEEMMNKEDFLARKREDDEQERVLKNRIDELKAHEIGMDTNVFPALIEVSKLWEISDNALRRELMQAVFEYIIVDCDVETGVGKRKGQELPFKLSEISFN